MELPECLVYDETSPTCFRWAVNKGRGRKGCVAGTKHNQGYFSLSIDKERYLAHRLVWMIHHGEIPKGFEIDHIDRDRSNTKISNLRMVTRHHNNGNMSKQKGKLSQYKGVSVLKNGTYQAYIKMKGKKVHLGTFEKEEDAAEAYKIAAVNYFQGIVGGLVVEI